MAKARQNLTKRYKQLPQGDERRQLAERMSTKTYARIHGVGKPASEPNGPASQEPK